MFRTVTAPTMTWIDVSSPTQEDLTLLAERHPLHPLILEEFVTPTFRPKVTPVDGALFFSIHIPLYDTAERTTYPAEIDVVIAQNYLITAHTADIDQLTHFFTVLSEHEGKRRIHMTRSSAHLLYDILELLIDSCFPRLDHILKKIDTVEQEIFHGNEHAMVQEISLVKRDILNFRRTLMPQRSVLESLLNRDTPLLPAEIRPYYQDLIGSHIRLWNTLQSSKETIESLEETNNSLLSYKINERMRFLTIFSVLFIPISLYVNIFGMNTVIPLQDSPFGFPVHIIIMVTIGVLTFFILRSQRRV